MNSLEQKNVTWKIFKWEIYNFLVREKVRTWHYPHLIKDVGSIVKYLRITQLLPPEVTTSNQTVVQPKGKRDNFIFPLKIIVPPPHEKKTISQIIMTFLWIKKGCIKIGKFFFLAQLSFKTHVWKCKTAQWIHLFNSEPSFIINPFLWLTFADNI